MSIWDILSKVCSRICGNRFDTVFEINPNDFESSASSKELSGFCVVFLGYKNIFGRD